MAYQINPFTGKLDITPFSLDGAGKIPSDYLPSYVDDVVEYDDLASFPGTGETGKIYVAKDTGYTYRWTGSVYVRIGSGGDVALNLGNAASPSLYFTGDTNTGIYSPGADQLALSTNGTGRLFVDANGKVGVGTASPQDQLHLTGSLYAEQRVYAGDGTAATPSIRFWNSNVGLYAPGSNALGFSTGSSERLRITSAGLVGIGTSSPDTSLEVVSSDGTGVSSKSLYTQTTNNNKALKVRNNSTTDTFSVSYRGQGYFASSVGIGTTSPATLLHLRSTGTPIFRIQDDDGTAQYSDFYNSAGQSIYNAVNGAGVKGAHIFLQAGTEAARIDSSGRLLVGTSSDYSPPSQNLIAQFNAVNTAIGGIAVNNWSISGAAPGGRISLTRANATTAGTFTTCTAFAQYGQIDFWGADGTKFVEAARIIAYPDGTPGADDMPGRLVFSVTADGASSPTEALRISNNRAITVSDGGNVVLGTTTGTKIGTATTQKLGFYNATPVVQPAAVADATAATVITQLNDLLAKLRTLGIIAT